jgi:hypothetical protein
MEVAIHGLVGLFGFRDQVQGLISIGGYAGLSFADYATWFEIALNVGFEFVH